MTNARLIVLLAMAMATATTIETHATLNSMLQRVCNDTTMPRPVRFAAHRKVKEQKDGGDDENRKEGQWSV